MLDDLLVQTATVLVNGAGTVDAEGNVIRTSSPTVYPCRLGQQQSREDVGEGPTVERTTWLLYLPSGATCGPHDRVTVDGVTYEVDGLPFRVLNGDGTEHHVEAKLLAVSR